MSNKEGGNKKSLYTAILAVQQGAPSIDKAADNPYFKSKYADLPTVWGSIRELMGENGLFVNHVMTYDDGVECIVTRIYHAESGDSIASVSKVMLQKSTPQEYGSYITYMRRYALTAMLGLVTDDDDDGNKAVVATERKPKQVVLPVTGEEFVAMQKMIKEVKSMDELKSVMSKINTSVPRMNSKQKETITTIKDKQKALLESQKGESQDE